MSLTLLSIERDGRVESIGQSLPVLAIEVLTATQGLYDTTGFEKPWIGYLARVGSELVGTCGFKSPPRSQRVEIAYFTFPGFENRGFATAMAAELVAIAKSSDPTVTVAARTLPRTGASTRVLEKLGFHRVGIVSDPDDGEVWEWRLPTSEGRGRGTGARSRSAGG